MSEENKAIVGRWFTEFWGNPWNPDAGWVFQSFGSQLLIRIE